MDSAVSGNCKVLLSKKLTAISIHIQAKLSDAVGVTRALQDVYVVVVAVVATACWEIEKANSLCISSGSCQKEEAKKNNS